MPNDLNLSTKPTLEFTTLEVRIIEHLVSSVILDRELKREKMLAKPSSRRRETQAEFDMGLEPLRQMQTKISLWLNERRAT